MGIHRGVIFAAAVTLLVALLVIPSVAGAATSNCFASPNSCGYPDPTNTGPSGTLTPSGSITAATDGQTIEDKEVSGSITVTAANVTIRNVKVTATTTGGGSCTICASNADGLRVIDSRLSGNGSVSSTVEAAVRDYRSVAIEGTSMELCNECVQGGAVTLKDSYAKVSSIYAGAHAEDIYICSDAVEVTHSTLLNEQNQTATVFGDTICGGGNDFTVTDSLLAGGGYVLYPQANSGSAVGTSRIVGNRFGRCETSAVYNPGSGGTSCSGGTDSFGYYPLGGYYGLAAYTYSPPNHVWEGNVWDDSSAAVCDDGRLGCAGASEPPEEEEEEEVETPEEEVEEEAPPEEPETPGEAEEPAPPVEETQSPPATTTAAISEPIVLPADAAGLVAQPARAALRAIWRLPRAALPGHTVILSGSGSRGAQPLACRWTVAGRSRVFRRHRGCTLRFRMPRAGVRFVTLKVRDGLGRRDSLRRVASGPRLR